MDNQEIKNKFEDINNICEGIKCIFTSFKDTIDEKEIKINNLQNELSKIHFEESNFNNFSIIKQQDKEITKLKRQLEDLTKKIQFLENKLKDKKPKKKPASKPVIEEPIEEPKEETKEESIEEPKEETKEESIEEPKEESIEEPKEESIEEPKEEPKKKEKKKKVEKLDLDDLETIENNGTNYFKSNLNYVYEISNGMLGRKMGKFKKKTKEISFY